MLPAERENYSSQGRYVPSYAFEMIVIEVGTVAMAAVLLHESKNAHSTLKIPILCTAKSTCSISVASVLGMQLKTTYTFT